jgi:hypothetical protein
MIFLVDIKNDPNRVAFMFQQKELPENISINSRTKLNTIEYNGGIITNQLIGVYDQPIEWEGCFFGSYPNNQYAKDRADEIKSFLGRPVKFTFAVPTSNSVEIPENSVPKTSGHTGIYYIEEYDVTINNYADVNYRIKLVPHVSQSQAKPKEIEVQTIKILEENVYSSTNAILKAKPKNPQAGAAKQAAAKSAKTTNKVKPQGEESNKGAFGYYDAFKNAVLNVFGKNTR